MGVIMYEIQNDKSALPIIRTSVMENSHRRALKRSGWVSVEYGKIASGLHDKMYCIWTFLNLRINISGLRNT